MSFFAKRLIAALLLTAYAAASVLSSAFHDHQHGASCASHQCAAKEKTAKHTHRCRHHHHDHAHDEHAHDGHSHGDGHEHESGQHPLHDDHCSSCHFLGLASVITPPVALPDGSEMVSQVSAARPIAPVSSVARLWQSRAPPAQA